MIQRNYELFYVIADYATDPAFTCTCCY